MMIRLACVLFALSSITVLAGAAVAPALADIGRAFPDTDSFYIRMIISLPALAVLPASFMADSLCRRFGKKNVLLTGLALYLVGGCGGGLVDNIFLLLCLRAILGMGMGLITPVTHSLPGDFFQGSVREGVVSRMAAFVTMGAAVCSILAGWLALTSWRASFMVYLVALPVGLLVIAWLPDQGRKNEPVEGKKREKLPAKMYLLGMSMLLYMSAFYVFPLCLAGQLKTAGVGDAGFAGVMFAFLSVIGFLAGMVFSRCIKLFGAGLLPLLLFSLGAGSLVTAYAGDVPAALLGGLLAGFGLGLTPLHFVAVNNTVAREQLVRAMSVVVAGTFAGQFCSPFYIELLESVPFTCVTLITGQDIGVFEENGILLVTAGVIASITVALKVIRERARAGHD